ncbi:hypothetical protein AA14337_2756 [Acetobacter malorum DSM 14337]|uniref:Phage neck terminator protein gp12-like domain-containing protein n=1 Tax=Acetobacter malorum DSM 14337 TaxID=1307910 RepID=A0ABQ0PXL3_9PROT|nr:hypothetical protein [Acetobacter malorum]KXV05234.1 hypothetical protein AD930_14060 [Acetobacter malorum]GBQ84079.1 hypothetical protein AA14337_2756 [Acetobacter malorum DSM 14337]
MVETSGYPTASVSLPPVTAATTTALRAFLQTILPPDLPVLLARQNRMAAPNGPFALMAVLLHQPIATSATRYTANTRIILQQQDVTVQVSLFGDGAADNVQRISTLFQNGWAAEFFTAFHQNPAAQNTPPPRIAPLYAGPARQIPFINGERQYEDQWQIDLHLQASFALSLPQPMASAARLALADVTSPQGSPSA